MDGCQWDVLEVNMLEEYPKTGYAMHTSTWKGCLKFVYDHLLQSGYSAKYLTIYCDDGKHIISRDTLISVMKQEYPEDFI
jgi:hypothetical protein